MAARKRLTLSVKQLVDFACRGGDLIASGPLGPTAEQGVRGHQKLQRARADGQQAELRVAAEVALDGYTVSLSGRVDLATPGATPPQLAEIKTCLAPPAALPPAQRALHWAQLKVYGFCYAESEELAGELELCLIYLNLTDDRQTRDRARYRRDELRAFTEQALRRYLRWQRLIDRQQRAGRASARALSFPHEQFRPGQRTMAAAIYRTARDGGTLLCEAPTGTGKTVSSLFPAVKAIGERRVRAAAYLTAKTSGRQAAVDCLRLLRERGLRLSALLIEAKQRACFCHNGGCERGDDGVCPMTLGFFDRLPPARERLLEHGLIDGAALDAAARQWRLCPFGLSLQMLPWVSLVICDYNYVFDPLARLAHFTDNGKRTLLLIDEAHNLVDRARQMYSARLSRADSRRAAADCAAQPLLAKRLDGVGRALQRYAKRREQDIAAEPPKTVARAVAKSLEVLYADGAARSRPPTDWSRELIRYGVIGELFREQHRALLRRRGRDVEVKLYCIDAAELLRDSYRRFRAVVMFSASLRPQRFYLDALGLPAQTAAFSLPSPFRPERLGCMVCPFVDTRYRARQRSLTPLADIIHSVYRGRAGNYLAFFPSYAYLQAALQVFAERYPDIDVAAQTQDADEAQRRAFLQKFSAGAERLGFAIMGGIYGEGVDYPGERLLGAIIVGAGLPSPGAEQQLIQNDYDNRDLDGFDYAYRFPGFTRVLQTAGRVIRSEADKGVVVLVDSRFQQRAYRELYPAHWRARYLRDSRQLQTQLALFWQEA